MISLCIFRTASDTVSKRMALKGAVLCFRKTSAVLKCDVVFLFSQPLYNSITDMLELNKTAVSKKM